MPLVARPVQELKLFVGMEEFVSIALLVMFVVALMVAFHHFAGFDFLK